LKERNYGDTVGEKISYDNAFSKLWQLFGFALAEKNRIAKEFATEPAPDEAAA